MKRIIIIIFSVVLTMNVLAQRELGLDEIAKSIDAYNFKHKSHQKGLYVVFEHTVLIDRSFRNTKGIKDFVNDKLAKGMKTLDAETIKSRIDNEEKAYKETCTRVRQMLDSLIRTSDESHHFETHNKDKDTISYSICLESNKNRRLSENDWESPDTTETLTFTQRSTESEIGKRVYFRLTHKRIEYADNKKEKCFDFAAYHNTIIPILKQEGVKTWDFNWQIDAKEYTAKEKDWSGVYGDQKASGIRKGKMFFIPLKDEVLTKKIMDDVSKVTEDYLANNGDQIYYYDYNVYDEAKKRLQKGRPALFLQVLSGVLDFSATEEGYYITLFDKSSGLQGYPKEWSILKSFVNGKKEYIEDAKK